MATMELLTAMQTEGHEQVEFFFDRATGLRAIVAIHSTKLGPALGGCRMRPYRNEADALRDVLRLSQAMTLKNAVMDLPLGGGKAVIIGDPHRDKTPELIEAFGRCVERLGGLYITSEDVGTSVEDLVTISRTTTHVVGMPDKSGSPGVATAIGVCHGIKAALKHVFGDDSLRGRRVAIQGLGSVGWRLCGHLHAEGAELVVTDVLADAVERAVAEFGATPVAPDRIYDVECDVFSPCALGAILNDETIPRLRCRIVAGSANNQLAEERHAEELRRRGIAYAPDFVINGGGVVNLFGELEPGGYNRERVMRRLVHIGAKVARALSLADELGVTTNAAAVLMARERLEGQAAGVATSSD